MFTTEPVKGWPATVSGTAGVAGTAGVEGTPGVVGSAGVSGTAGIVFLAVSVACCEKTRTMLVSALNINLQLGMLSKSIPNKIYD